MNASKILQHLMQQAGGGQKGSGVAVTDEQNPMERAWLDQLASALNLPQEMVDELERQAQQAG